jgi:hypothetical protein
MLGMAGASVAFPPTSQTQRPEVLERVGILGLAVMLALVDQEPVKQALAVAALAVGTAQAAALEATVVA